MEVAVFPASYDRVAVIDYPTSATAPAASPLRHVGRDPPSHRHPQKGNALCAIQPVAASDFIGSGNRGGSRSQACA